VEKPIALPDAAAAAAELDQNRVDLVAVDVDEIEAADISLLLKDLARRGVPSLALGTPSRLAAIPRGTFSFLIAKPIEEAALVLAAVEAALREIEAPREG
jgi:hypothetical protein